MEKKNNRNAALLRWTFLVAAALSAGPGGLLAQNENASAPAPAAPAPPAPSAAQTPPPASTEQGAPVIIKQESRLVLVDAVVTDKKGNYIKDLKQTDFKVYEDNKEQSISSFSSGSDGAIQANGQKRYLILFFDNSTMQAPDQIQARNAANKFIAANANADHLMAVVDFGGA
ncbi:MAG: VWA domain-containing protein, partial [Candidatus Acidiferrum sp.]